jgi:hypothetical protein
MNYEIGATWRPFLMFNNCKEEIGVGVVGMNITLFCPGKTIH